VANTADLAAALMEHQTERSKAADHMYPLPRESILVQEIVARPLLYNGYKFDMRCYVLVIKMFDTVTGFFYNEGVARICSGLHSVRNANEQASTMANRVTQLRGSLS
jgi:hypothetical protein